MNNLKKTAVMFLAVAMAISMLMVPFTPITQVAPQVTTPQVSTPEDVRMDLQKYLDDRSVDGPLDSILTAYKDSGIVPNNVVTNADGAMGALITVSPDINLGALDDIVDVNWKVDFGVVTIVSAFIGSVEAVTALETFDGVVTAFADSLYKGTNTNSVPARDPIAIEEVPINSEPASYATTVEIGADLVVLDGTDGTGVRVGVIDTGTDFSHPELVDAIDFGSDGLPTSYDPSGWGFANNLYRVNLTTVNVTNWLGYSSWNMLSFEDNGKYYIDTTTYQHNHGSPYINYMGSVYDLDWWFDVILPAWWPDGYLDDPELTANITEFYYDAMRQPLELPDPATISGGGAINITMTGNDTIGTWKLVPYACHGYAVQRRYDPSMRIFAPMLTVNGSVSIVDWNTTRAWTDFWNLNVNYGVWDFSEQAAWDYYNAMGDWSFADDLAAGYYYTADGTVEHTNMYFDYTDGARFGLGILAHVWDPIYGQGMIDGHWLGGRQVGIMYDSDSHGTFVAGEIASRGGVTYPIGLDGAMESLPGVAPGSTIMGVSTVGIVSEFNSMLWAAGFDFNYGTGYWEWNYYSGHQMDITSNSWGWVTPQYYELYGQYSLIYAALATPGFFNATHYPGMIQCFSAGNAGPGYGTTTPPRAPQLINVGASTSYHTFENSYGDDQGFDQVASFSSRGPLTLGYSKPDVLAPGQNNWGLVPFYGATFGITDTIGVEVYGGTSMACPMVAGVAALLVQAYLAENAEKARPDMIKTIIQSTADDIGMDGLSQGFGVVNAWAAYDYVVNGVGNVFYTMDSMTNWATATTEAWDARMNPYDLDNYIETATPPTDFADGNLYFGLVEGGDVVTMTIEGDYGDFADWEWNAQEFVEDTRTTFSFETYIYNESISTGYNTTKAGWFSLATELDTAYDNFADSTYATIFISGLQATFDDDSVWAFVFDWNDVDPANGVPDYYNTTTGEGNELTRWTYGGGSGNVLKMDLSHPGGLNQLFPNNGIVMVHDDNTWSWPYTGGNTLEVTVVTWQRQASPGIAFADNSGKCDVTLTVPAMDSYGVHQGFINVTGVGGVYMIPYTYNVYATYDTEGEVMTLADGDGGTWTPYEPGILSAGFDSYYSTRSADHASIVVDLTDSSVMYLAARAAWTNADTDMDVAIVDMTGVEQAHSGDAVKATDTSALAIAEVEGTTGMYIIYTTMNMIEGPAPEEYVLTVIGYDALDEPVLTLSYTTRDMLTPTEFTSGDTIAGDHVIVTATWTDGTMPGMPEWTITSTEVQVLYGVLFYEEGPMADVTNPSQFSGIIDPDQFAWVTVPDLNAGDTARIVCDSDSSDADVMAWWSTVPMEERSYDNNVLEDNMASSAHPETLDLVLLQSGDLEFGILDYAQEGGNYYLTVDTRLGLSPPREYDQSVSLDTYYLLANQTYSILVDSDTGTNLRYSIEIPAVTIGNFFAPKVYVPTPMTDLVNPNVRHIFWVGEDQNADDTVYYSVWLSSNEGAIWQLVAQNLTGNYYRWDSTGWVEDNYIIRVRAYSVDLITAGTTLDLSNVPAGYWPGDYGEGFSPAFFAGDIPSTEPTPTTDTTTTDTTPTTTDTGSETTTVEGLDPLLIGLVAGLGVGVVVILILFLIRKK